MGMAAGGRRTRSSRRAGVGEAAHGTALNGSAAFMSRAQRKSVGDMRKLHAAGQHRPSGTAVSTLCVS